MDGLSGSGDVYAGTDAAGPAARSYSGWAEQEIKRGELPLKSGSILEAILYRGELPRGDADVVAGTGERQARRIVSALVAKGVLKAESSRGALRLVFPAALARYWMPGLFPEEVV